MARAKAASSIDLDAILDAGHLPALPQSAISILELAQNPENGPGEFAPPIEADPGLTSQVLKFVNSSYFGFSREISSVRLAITLVGVRTMKNFVLWSAVFSLMPNPKCGPFDLRQLWQDSLRRAIFARRVARILGYKEAEECFAAALLQDMAVPLLAKESPEVYAELLERRDGGRQRLSSLEQERFGWTHAEIAAQMAGRWNLPDELAELLAHHIDVDAVLDAGTPAALAVALSSQIAAVADEQWFDLPALREKYDQVRPQGTPELADVLAEVDSDFAEFAPILNLPLPEQTLVERQAAETEAVS